MFVLQPASICRFGDRSGALKVVVALEAHDIQALRDYRSLLLRNREAVMVPHTIRLQGRECSSDLLWHSLSLRILVLDTMIAEAEEVARAVYYSHLHPAGTAGVEEEVLRAALAMRVSGLKCERAAGSYRILRRFSLNPSLFPALASS